MNDTHGMMVSVYEGAARIQAFQMLLLLAPLFDLGPSNAFPGSFEWTKLPIVVIAFLLMAP